ncbi:hypothetical protein FRB94_002736 [Tulasnella sp. JGI-2019a]|nr:hypothetical protein FRB94_002736 [Tulasnella sp. JGI-2019a]KAG9013331.1 hypothetical protein FRB93_000854 [Tulasnella sp. JGI-2019a]KAG9032915.1 hypothetical protein FRB95_000849 [Tulasnella sp. JGI-2019a]
MMATESISVFRSFNNGNKVPWIGYGTGTAVKRYSSNAAESILVALTSGFTHIDTAEKYNTEEAVGIAVQTYLSGESRPSRDSIFITTKFYDALQPGQTVKDRLKESLKKLQVDYVDLYLIHTPVSHSGKLKDIWKQMEGVLGEGLTKNIGVSNFRVKDYGEFISDASIIPACNQIEFHPYVLSAVEPIMALQHKFGILTSSYSGLSPLHKFKGGPIDAVLTNIRDRYSRDLGLEASDEQILTKWALSKGVVPITTSLKEERLVSLLKTIELPDLNQSEIGEINEAGRKEHHRVYQRHMDE